MKKLFACCLYAENPFSNTDGTLQTSICAAAIAATNTESARICLMQKLKRDLPFSAGWRNHYVSVLEIPTKLIEETFNNG